MEEIVKYTLKFNLNYSVEKQAYDIIEAAAGGASYKDKKAFIMAAILEHSKREGIVPATETGESENEQHVSEPDFAGGML